MPAPPPFTDDLDGDGYSPPADCDDSDPDIHPAAVDVPYNGIDEDCDGADLTDVDGDGHDGELAGGEDCNDANPEIHPEAEELCDNGTDEDCDLSIDESCGEIADPGDPGGFAWACAQVSAELGGCWAVWLLALGLVLLRRYGSSASSP